MGLLDDAIREHLELKRQHGAPDDEIQRAEQEALGPARRDPSAETAGLGVPAVQEVPGEPLEEPLGEPLEEPLEEPLYEPAPAGYDEPEPGPRMELESLEELESEELEEAPPPGTPKPHGDPAIGDYPEPVVNLDDLDEDPEANVPPPPPPPAEDPHRASTTILDDPLDQSEESEDVLEETPEFLQDTPEHDKLWFEQKPPRDFDFD